MTFPARLAGLSLAATLTAPLWGGAPLPLAGSLRATRYGIGYVKLKGRKWPRFRLIHKAGIALLWCFAVAGALVLINLAGAFLAGNIERWQEWMRSHASLFFIWRLVLYANIAAGWVWMRRRVLQREPSQDTHWRLARVELACIVAVALLEATQAMKGALA